MLIFVDFDVDSVFDVDFVLVLVSLVVVVVVDVVVVVVFDVIVVVVVQQLANSITPQRPEQWRF